MKIKKKKNIWKFRLWRCCQRTNRKEYIPGTYKDILSHIHMHVCISVNIYVCMCMFIYAINCISVYLAVAFYCSLGAGNALKILLFQHKMTFGLHLLLSLPTKVPAAVTQRRVALACLAHKFRCFFWKLSDLCGFWYIFF